MAGRMGDRMADLIEGVYRICEDMLPPVQQRA